MRAIFAHVMAMLVVTSVASAESRGGRHKEADAGSALGADSDEGAADEQDGQDDQEGQAATATAIPRTPDQIATRRAVVDMENKAIGDIVHAGGRPISGAERQAIGVHWRHVMRLLRIRELAETDGDKAVVTRVDGVLARESTKFSAKLTRLHDEPSNGSDPGAHAKGGAR